MNNSTYKFNNIEEMGQFLKKHKLPQLTSPLDCKEIKPVHPKRNQP